MRGKIPGMIAVLALLAGCGTPQERCENRAVRRIDAKDADIRETERALASGYRNVAKSYPVTRFYGCKSAPSGFCSYVTMQTTTTPVVIDRPAEERLLEQQRAERAALARTLDATLAACAAPPDRVISPDGPSARP